MATVDTATQNRALYLQWIRTTFPELYSRAVGIDASGMSGIFDSIGSAFNNFVQNVSTALPSLANSYAQIKTQQQLIEANSQRAQQGLPPLVYQNGQLVPMTGSYTDQDYEIARTGGLSTNTVIMLGAAVLLALILITRPRGRR